MRKLTQQKKEPGTDYARTGPARSYESEKAMYQDLAAVWKRCSLQMHQICKVNGIKYFHFLQPNQYVAGSKPMGKEERLVALRDKHPYRQPVERGYSCLIEAGKDLVEEGVSFHDLTKVFSSIDEPLYVDACCHVNQEGNSVLARAIGESIAAKTQVAA